MSESMGFGPKSKEQIEQEINDEYAKWYLTHKVTPKIPDESLLECGPEIKEFEDMLSSFEANHPIADLYAIVDLTQADAPNHPVREPARLALAPIVQRWYKLKDKTNIPAEKLGEIRKKYNYLARSVGMISNITNKVDHER